MRVERLASVDELLAVLAGSARPGNAPNDEDHSESLDQLAHGLQCGHELATRFPDDIELQVAGLVHDIGHALMPRGGEIDEIQHDLVHGIVAGDAIRDLLGERVATLVELHVPAKRYLVAVEGEYGDVLSRMSAITLTNQGGPMTADEVAEFEALADVDAAVALRRADEAAKVPGKVVPGLDHWRTLLESLAR